VSESTLIRPIPPELRSERGWTVHVDGDRLESVAVVIIEHPHYGKLSYGLTPHGYDGWVFAEARGGVGLLVHVELDGELFVVVVEQDRPNQGGFVLNIPRGFIDLDEDPLTAARRELKEETGLELAAERFVQLPGAPGNPNSAFFDTRGPDTGVRFYAVRLEPAELPGQSWARPSGGEQIRCARLVPWFELAGFADMVGNAGLARLLASRRRGAAG